MATCLVVIMMTIAIANVEGDPANKPNERWITILLKDEPIELNETIAESPDHPDVSVADASLYEALLDENTKLKAVIAQSAQNVTQLTATIEKYQLVHEQNLELKEVIATSEQNISRLQETRETYEETLARLDMFTRQANLENHNSLLENRLAQLEEQNMNIGRLAGKIEELEQKNTYLQERMEQSLHNCSALECSRSGMSEPEMSIVQLQEKFTAFERNHTVSWNMLQELLKQTVLNVNSLQSAAIPIGFTANTRSSREYEPMQRVIFDRIQTNPGGHYDPNTGFFHCPASGTYLLSVTYYPQYGSDIVVEIMKESASLVRGRRDGLTQIWDHGTATAVASCLEGERAWLRAMTGGTLTGGTEEHFSGFLLQPY